MGKFCSKPICLHDREHNVLVLIQVFGGLEK